MTPAMLLLASSTQSGPSRPGPRCRPAILELGIPVPGPVIRDQPLGERDRVRGAVGDPLDPIAN